MTTVLPTPDASIVTRFVNGDENALTLIYRQQYDGLLAAAAERLGHGLAHFRGRVAHKAMLDAWQARERFQTPVALSAFLEEATRQEADIQRHKHAALHRREDQATPHVTVDSIDEAVTHLLDALHAPPVDHVRAAEEARTTKRAHAKAHVERVAGRPKWLLYGGGTVAAMVAIIIGQRVLDKAGSEVAVDRALKGDEVQTLTSGRGQRGTLTLRDGTKAAMGSETRLVIPEAFGRTQRTIQLDGTATFTTTASASAQSLPFSVRAGAVTVSATGTVFTVRHYPEDQAVVVQVTDGSVMITDRSSGAAQRVQAGSAVRWAQGAITVLDGVARDVALAWTRDSIVFDRAPLKSVVPELVRWFGINAALIDERIGDRPVSMRIALASSGDATKALTAAANLTISFGKDDRLEFSAGPEAPTTKK
jgi:ferric-dicitrate binding protein FerR (iron transport regulator)